MGLAGSAGTTREAATAIAQPPWAVLPEDDVA